MEIVNNNIVFIIVSIIVTAIGGIYTLLQIAVQMKKTREAEAKKLLEEAKESNKLAKNELEVKIKALSTRLDNLEDSVNAEFSHVKEIHVNEIKNLGEKIEQLRDELRENSSKLFELLTKLVDK